MLLYYVIQFFDFDVENELNETTRDRIPPSPQSKVYIFLKCGIGEFSFCYFLLRLYTCDHFCFQISFLISGYFAMNKNKGMRVRKERKTIPID